MTNIIKEFIDCGINCPVCGNQLNLFMVVEGSACFQAVRDYSINLQDFFKFSHTEHVFMTNEFKFVPVYNKSTHKQPYKALGAGYHLDDNEVVYLAVSYGDNDIRYNSDNCYNVINNKNVHFFYICNTSAIKDLANDFRINLHNACYYRSTPKMKLSDTTFTLLDEVKPIPTKNEVVSIHKQCDDIEKVFVLSMDFNDNKTKFYYYKITNKDKEEKKAIRPKLLEKEFDFLIKHPDFSLAARDKLISKFESWVILS